MSSGRESSSTPKASTSTSTPVPPSKAARASHGRTPRRKVFDPEGGLPQDVAARDALPRVDEQDCEERHRQLLLRAVRGVGLSGPRRHRVGGGEARGHVRRLLRARVGDRRAGRLLGGAAAAAGDDRDGAPRQPEHRDRDLPAQGRLVQRGAAPRVPARDPVAARRGADGGEGAVGEDLVPADVDLRPLGLRGVLDRRPAAHPAALHPREPPRPPRRLEPHREGALCLPPRTPRASRAAPSLRAHPAIPPSPPRRRSSST